MIEFSFERILGLKPWSRFQAAKAATGKGPIAEARGLRPALRSVLRVIIIRFG
jgi:hypothetical protein